LLFFFIPLLLLTIEKRKCGIAFAGVGKDDTEAMKPAVLRVSKPEKNVDIKIAFFRFRQQREREEICSFFFDVPFFLSKNKQLLRSLCILASYSKQSWNQLPRRHKIHSAGHEPNLRCSERSEENGESGNGGRLSALG
jgi:hypothetical protein